MDSIFIFSDDKKTILGLTDKSIDTIVIPEYVTDIKDHAFMGCPNLKRISFNDNLSSLKGCMLCECKQLDEFVCHKSQLVKVSCSFTGSISVPNGITNIAKGAFCKCLDISAVQLPESVTSIGIKAFSNCQKLRSVNLPNNLVFIGEEAFEGCSITEITIPDKVETLEHDTFCNCKELKTVFIGKNVSTINDDAFSKCEKLVSIDVHPENKFFMSINGVLYNKECTKLVRVPLSYVGDFVMPESIAEMEFSCFTGCNSITNIHINKNITELKCCGYLAELASLSSINVNTSNTAYQSIDGVLYDKQMTTLLSVPKMNEGKLIIPEGIEKISQSAFFKNEKIEYISLPRSLRMTIFYHITKGFLSCMALKHLDVNEENPDYASKDGILYDKGFTTIIGYPANSNHEYSFPLSVKKIGRWAFANTKNLKEIVIPSTVQIIEPGAFMNSSLEYVEIKEGVETINSAFANCHLLKMVKIPKTVQSISNAFSNCDNLSKVELNGVPKEMNDCFEGCSSIIEPIIYDDILIHVPERFSGIYKVPENVKTIKQNAFTNCNVEEVYLPDSVNIIETSAFSRLKSLKRIRLSNSLKEIGKHAFNSCTDLEEIAIPNSIDLINDFTFWNCKKLKYVKLPKELKSIGSGAFRFCSKLESITMPETLSDLGESAFSECKNLRMIRVPYEVDTIKSKTFENCKSLYSISVARSVKTIYNNAFSGTNIKEADMSETWDSKRQKLGLPPAPYRPSHYRSYQPRTGAYTYGRISPCPYCGSRSVQSYADGTAVCESCGGEYRYA